MGSSVAYKTISAFRTPPPPPRHTHSPLHTGTHRDGLCLETEISCNNPLKTMGNMCQNAANRVSAVNISPLQKPLPPFRLHGSHSAIHGVVHTASGAHISPFSHSNDSSHVKNPSFGSNGFGRFHLSSMRVPQTMISACLSVSLSLSLCLSLSLSLSLSLCVCVCVCVCVSKWVRERQRERERERESVCVCVCLSVCLSD